MPERVRPGRAVSRYGATDEPGLAVVLCGFIGLPAHEIASYPEQCGHDGKLEPARPDRERIVKLKRIIAAHFPCLGVIGTLSACQIRRGKIIRHASMEKPLPCIAAGAKICDEAGK